jgi:hypothetical protein
LSTQHSCHMVFSSLALREFLRETPAFQVQSCNTLSRVRVSDCVFAMS